MAPVCFVVMGFGRKVDLATGRQLDLDKSYKSIIKPAVEAANYQCLRADELQETGMIDVPMYKWLYEAELVIADLSTTNPNAIFELGVRHALKPRATIIIAEQVRHSLRRDPHRRPPLRASRNQHRLRRGDPDAGRAEGTYRHASRQQRSRQPGLCASTRRQ